jgi:hypothetical protein
MATANQHVSSRIHLLTREYRQKVLLLSVAASSSCKSSARARQKQLAEQNQAASRVLEDRVSSTTQSNFVKAGAVEKDHDGIDNSSKRNTNNDFKEDHENLPSWHVTQRMLEQLYHGSKNLCHSNNVDKSLIPPASTSSEKRLYVCPDCGAILQPGWNGTTLRVVRRPRIDAFSKNGKQDILEELPGTLKSKHVKRSTLRRRRQRREQQRARAKQKGAKPMSNPLFTNTKKTPPPTNDGKNDNEGNVNGLENVQLIPLVDDGGYLQLDRHFLVITCGSCQGKIHLKGVKQPKKKNMQSTATPTTTTSSSSRSTKLGSLTPSLVVPSLSAKTTVRDGTRAVNSNSNKRPRDDDNGNQEEEFLSLPSRTPPQPPSSSRGSVQLTNPSKVPPTKQQQQQQQQHERYQRNLAVLQAGSKRKKKKQQPPNRLMDFLSSLND